MNTYEAKQEARRTRYEAKAAAAAQEAAATYNRARGMASLIPFGQPILIGHHSERADRAFRGRIHTTFGRSFAQQDKADHYARKAAAVGKGGISADDPDAVAKLRAELEKVQALQDKMKKANAAVRKNDRAALAALGFSAEQIDGLFTPDFAGRVGFPSYALTNNRANARRIEGRIKELEAKAQAADVEQDGAGYTYREDTAENRVIFVFPGKPDDETRQVLKAHAFKWSPSRGAWVRQLTAAGRAAAARVRAELDA